MEGKKIIATTLNEPFQTYSNIKSLRGVEMFNAYEHFPIISVKSLNLIGKVVKKLEKVLADNLVGNNVEQFAYKF